jgi:hypothetical protein
VPKARAIQLTAKDVKDLKKTLQTEWFAASGPEQAYGIIDTILNRLERFLPELNQRGFTRSWFSDSRSVLAKEAGMDGSSFIA